MSADFPIADRNNMVSQASKRLFPMAAPLSWRPTELGTDDFGFDYQIQVISGDQVRNAFRLQLKGTECPRLSADGKFLKVGLSRQTLNLYANTQDEVMLVLVVVKIGASGQIDDAGCRVYWCWIGAELERLRGSRFGLDLSSVESTTIHIPTSQVLMRDLNVGAFLEDRLKRARAVEGLEAIVRDSQAFGASDDPLERFIKVVQSRPELLSTLGQTDGEEPATPPGDGPQGQLAEAHAFIRAGRTALAEGAVARIERSAIERTPKLLASYLSVLGKIAIQRRNRAQALALFEQAYAAQASEKHLLAREEVKVLLAAESGDAQAMAAVANELAAVQTDDGLSLLVRVQVALGRFEEAHATIARTSEDRRLVSRLVALSGEGKWEEVGSLASAELAAGKLSVYDRIACRLIAARGAWERALAPAATRHGDDEEFPLAGPPGLNFEVAQEAWALSAQCLQDLRETGWPPNTELLAPVAVASACAVGKQSEALPLMREAAQARPEYGDVQKHLELLAISDDEPKVALEANLRQPEDHHLVARRTCLYFQLKQYTECLHGALSALSTLDKPAPQTAMALAMGSAAAVKLSRPLDRDKLMASIEGNPAWGEFVYFARFAQNSIEASKPQISALREGVLAYPESVLLAANLFVNLRVDEEASAREAVALYRAMRKFQAPTIDDAQRAIAAWLTLSAWEDAELEAREAIEHFGRTGRVLSMLAVAEEMLGRTGSAVALLEESLQSSEGRYATLRNYLGVMLRLGRMKQARETIEALLGREADRSERLELQRLKALILTQEGSFDEAYATVLKIGKEVDRAVEVEEGMYINVYMAVTFQRESPLPEDESKEISERIDAFCKTWPQSKLFRRATLPDRENLTTDDLHAMLDSVLGDSRKRMREFLEREQRLRSGEMPVPFVARPGFALHYIGDVFTLWEVGKRSKPEDTHYHLASFLPGEEPTTALVLRDVPLLDLTALLVLHDLGLIDILFRLSPRIAIPRRTVDYISQHARGILPASPAASLAERLLAVVNANLDRIDQPSSDCVAIKMINTAELLSDYVALARTGRWAVYSDDAITRALVRQHNALVKTISIVDLMRLADAEGFLTPAEVARHVATLASWNVVVFVSPRYLIATLVGAGDNYKQLSAAERLTLFHQHLPFTTLARALWRVDKAPTELIQHMANLVAETLKDPLTDEDSVAAVWAFWYLRVRLFRSMHQVTYELLCLSLMFAVQNSPPEVARRLVRTMLKVVEIAETKMSTQKQDEALRALGRSVGSLAKRNVQVGEQIRAKVTLALPSGTHDGEVFEAAYVDSLKAAQTQAGQMHR